MPDKKPKSTGITLDVTPIALRPLLPEDEPALQDLFAHMSREDGAPALPYSDARVKPNFDYFLT
jgi:hypothetical protein